MGSKAEWLELAGIGVGVVVWLVLGTLLLPALGVEGLVPLAIWTLAAVVPLAAVGWLRRSQTV